MKVKRTMMQRRERNQRKSMRMPWPILRKRHKLNNLKIRRKHNNCSNKKLLKQQRLRNNNNNRKQQPIQQPNRRPLKHNKIEKLRSKQRRKLKLCKS